MVVGLSTLILFPQPALADLVETPPAVAEPDAAELAAAKRTVNLTTTASPTVPVGAQIFGNANLLGAIAPTGTLTFKLFGPVDTACSAPIFTSVVAVTATSVDSGRYTTSQAGTYRWTSAYSGDDNHSAVGPTPCSEAAAAVIVDKVTTVLNVAASQPTTSTIRDTATLAGGFSPTGTITFALTPPGDTFCSGTPVFTSTVAVNGNGSYDSAPYSPPAEGLYRWRASYTGDANNRGVSITSCLDERQAVDFTRTSSAGDFDGDGRTDNAVYRDATSTWFVLEADGGTTTKYWGMAGDIPVAADYDGDRRTDYAVYRPSTGVWYVSQSTGGIASRYWGTQGDIPVPGDYDADGKSDHAVFRPSTGAWYVAKSTGGMTAGYWGMSGDVPVPGDYDGDTKTDYAVYRPSTGNWYVSRSAGGTAATYWGMTGDIPVPGDYDGDNKTDYAVYRPSTGNWHFNKSGGSKSTRYWGEARDVPVPGDYDADGTTDGAVFRPSTGSWYVNSSSGQNLTISQGAVGDKPVTLLPSIRLAYFA